MYRSLSHRGSLTEYVYVSTVPTSDTRVFLKTQLFLGQRIYPNSRRGCRSPLCLVGGPTMPAALCTLRPLRSRRELVRHTRLRCSCQQTEYRFSSFPVDRSLTLRTRMRQTKLARLDTRRFRLGLCETTDMASFPQSSSFPIFFVPSAR